MPYQERGFGRKGRSDRKHDGHHGEGKHKHAIGEKAREVLENIDADSPVIKCFQQYAAELDSKHDKYERIVKLSRDITIESKRIIFLLHTLDRDSKRETVLNEAMARLIHLVNINFKAIAKELKGEDPYQYMKAYSAGVQEYTEAVTFHHYLTSNSLLSWRKIQGDLTYTDKEVTTAGEDRSAATGVDSTVVACSTGGADEDGSFKTVMSPVDYILGVADLTGELMRKCINSLGSGNIEGCYHTCTFVREIYSGFLNVSCTGFKDISRKLVTLRQSLSKMENACYTIHVRGSEIPKHMLADVFSGTQDDFLEEDEGFY